MDPDNIKSLTDLRETTILIHLNAAFAELKDKIKTEPLKTKFHIYAGCVSKDIATEVAHRLTFDKVSSAKVCKGYGLFKSYNYLEVNVELPEHLIRHGELVIDEE